MQALWDQNKAYTSDNESNKNLLARYSDIEELFPDDLKGEALPYFIYWLKGKVLLLEIDTPSEDEAHTIFLTMNDRGLSLNSAEMLKAFIIQQVDEDFKNNRRKFGNLILLTRDHNRSYQDMPYDQKVVQYMGDNILAQSLNAGAYQNNPKFLALSNEYGFKAYTQFDKTAIRERLQLYTSLAKSIWNPAVIKELAGGWDDAMEITIQSGNARRFTVEYGSGRSWVDARKYGFVSAYGDGGTLLNNINVGDFIFCHIAGVGFVGIGTCTSRETPASSFSVNDNGIIKNILDCDWADQTARATIDPANEYFIGIKWIYTVSADDGYWEKGMTSLPMVAYMMNDETTHNKVLKHFNITLT